MLKKLPRILLVGAGKFGSKHLETLLALERAHKLILAGVVVRSKKSADALRDIVQGRIYREISIELLNSIDAAVIATPMDTHAELVARILPYAHVLVEKPLAMNMVDADRLVGLTIMKEAHALMVGHIFRFDPTVLMLKKLLKNHTPTSIEATFIQPEIGDPGSDIELELLHPFDIVDFLFGGELVQKYTEKRNRLRIIGAMYGDGMHAVYRLGWDGKEKIRMIKILADRTTITADILSGKIVFWRKGKIVKQYECATLRTPLESELAHFLKIVQGDNLEYPDAHVGAKIVELATRERDRPKLEGKPKVAIIGAGIFGTNCAIELSPKFAVTVFEKNEDILTEASRFNQYRHHWGYHYPRSQETMNDIASTIHDFEDRYNPAIIRDFPTYYSIAKTDSKVTTKEYLEFCKKNNLPYEIEYPDKKHLNRQMIKTSLKTFEPIYDFTALKRITAKLLKERRVRVRYNLEVVGARFDRDGRKILSMRGSNNAITEEKFDYVLNVTYARHNHFANWIGFPVKPMRLDLVEVTHVKLDIPKASFAVMDGPFTNMVPTGEPNMFTLVHINHSIRKRFVAEGGLVPNDIFSRSKSSITKKIINESAKWLPIVSQAEVMGVFHVIRGVNAYRENDDARTSDITEQGFGCYSILGGKIVHAVSVAREIAKRLNTQSL